MAVPVSPVKYELLIVNSSSVYGEQMKSMKFAIDDGARHGILRWDTRVAVMAPLQH